MTNTNKKGIHPVIAGAAGIVVGAAAGVIATALTKQENRKLVGKKFGEVQGQAHKVMDSLKKSSLTVQDTVKTKLQDMHEDASKSLEGGKKAQVKNVSGAKKSVAEGKGK